MPDQGDVATSQEIKSIADSVAATAATSFADSAILVRWVVVADWMLHDGRRCLTRIAPEESTVWENQGLLGSALNDWSPDGG